MRRTRLSRFGLLAALGCYFHRPLLSPDGEAGGGGAAAPAIDAEDDGPSLVREETPAAPTPAPEPVPQADPAPVPETPPPEPAAPAASLDKAFQNQQQELGTVRRDVQEIKTMLAELREARNAPAAAPATPAAPAATPDELEAMIAETYEVDVEKDPKRLAKEILDLKRTLRQQVDTVRTEAARDAANASRHEVAQAESRRAYEALQREHAGVDLAKLYGEAQAQAIAEGYKSLGDAALAHRASQVWQGKLDALKKPAPSAPAAGQPAPGAGRPATPATPNGAVVKVPNTGGNPQRPSGPSLDEDEIDSRHTLVKR